MQQIILKNGVFRKILLVSGTNFALKSEEEQGLITYAFQGFLNSLSFPVQIFIHSRKLNIEGYIQKIEERANQEPNELLKNQINNVAGMDGAKIQYFNNPVLYFSGVNLFKK